MTLVLKVESATVFRVFDERRCAHALLTFDCVAAERKQPRSCLAARCMCADERFYIRYDLFGCKRCVCVKPLGRWRRAAARLIRLLIHFVVFLFVIQLNSASAAVSATRRG